MIADKYREIIMQLNDEDLIQLIKYANIGKSKTSFESSDQNTLSGIRMTSTAFEKYKVLKAKTELAQRVDSDEMCWLNKIEIFKKISSNDLPDELSKKEEKEVFRYIYKCLINSNISEEMVQILTPYLTNYVVSGEIKKPLMFVGNPGCGKTEMAKIIASILGKPLYRTSPTQTDRNHGLRGEGSSYKSPDMGEIMRAVFETKCNNPVILFDEVSTGIKSNNQVNFEDEWLTILDDESMSVTDNYLAITQSLNHSLLIFTDNDLDRISLRFQDRCIVCKVPDVQLNRMTRIVGKYITSKVEESTAPIIFSENELFEHVSILFNHNIHSIRRMTDMVDLAINIARTKYNLTDAVNISVTSDDLQKATESIIASESKATRKMGFGL